MNDPQLNEGESVGGTVAMSTTMTGFEKAKETFHKAGLAFPQIPEELACRLEEQERWLFSTREVKMSPYNIEQYVDESYYSPPYVVLAHVGYGFNSYFLAYYLVFGPLRLFLGLSLGGAYMDHEANVIEIEKCFSLADKILPAAMTSGKLFPDEHLTIVCSDFYGNHWGLSLPEYVRRSNQTNQPASELLTKILKWLNDPKPRHSRLPLKPRKAHKTG